MKKLLAITLVLGLASAASAVVVNVDASGPEPFQVANGETLVFTLTSAGTNYSGLVDVPAAGGTLAGVGDPAAYGGQGFLLSPAELGDLPYWYFAAAGGPGSEPADGAAHFTFTYTASDDSSLVVLNLWEEDGATPIGNSNRTSISIQNTPEPMTLGLLGLGGLFLRRRK